MAAQGAGESGEPDVEFPDGVVPTAIELSAPERRLIRLIQEFRLRQWRRPDLVVRPWWTPAEGGVRSRLGCVIEYCPSGRESAELALRLERVTVDGPGGAMEADLDLAGGWVLEGRDAGSPETLVNYLLRLADRALGEAA